MTDGQQVLLHPDWIADAKTLLGRDACDGGVFRYPVRGRKYLALVLDQDAVICQSKCRQLEATTRQCSESPASKFAVNLVRHVGKPNTVSAHVCHENCFCRLPLSRRWIASAFKTLRIEAHVERGALFRLAQTAQQAFIVALVPGLP